MAESHAIQSPRLGRYNAGSHSTQAQEVLRCDSTPDEEAQQRQWAKIRRI